MTSQGISAQAKDPRAAVTAVRVSFFRCLDLTGPGTDSEPQAAGEPDTKSLVIEMDVATLTGAQAQSRQESRQLQKLAKLAHQAQQNRHDRTAWDVLAEATAHYVADKVRNSAASRTELWEDQGTLGPEALAETLERFQQALLGLVAQPLQGVATWAGAPRPEAAVLADIGASMVAAPVTRLVQQVCVIVDISGMVLGAATGMYPMAIACAHQLAAAELPHALAAGISSAVEGNFRVRSCAPERLQQLSGSERGTARSPLRDDSRLGREGRAALQGRFPRLSGPRLSLRLPRPSRSARNSPATRENRGGRRRQNGLGRGGRFD